VIVAHELAHIILKHRARMDAAGVKYGIFSELGRSGRLHAQAESEADRLSVYLLFNAGYDPRLAGAFWRGPGKKLDGGLFRNRAYRSWRERATALDAEAANIPTKVTAPFVPPMIALADQPMR
ncbi:MAG: peptidase M48 family protein, partial [Sphingomonas sp.]|nr:peptidase M48 family protein [Sphingomonas sp.]